MVRENADFLLKFALTKINDIDLAKDMVQDTFVSALTNISKFNQESKLSTWLISILNRKIIDYWRKADTKYTDPISSFFDQHDAASHFLASKMGSTEGTDYLSEKCREEEIEELEECISILPKKWAGIITSKYFQTKDSEVICNDFDISSSNLWVIVHRAKLLLRECLQSKIQ